jgi:hypothetical protein
LLTKKWALNIGLPLKRHQPSEYNMSDKKEEQKQVEDPHAPMYETVIVLLVV